MAEIIPFNRLKQKIKVLKAKNKKIVATNGCFDILHIGHIRSLQKAKLLGDVLVVGLNSDASVRKIKGKTRPINNEKTRAEVLSALACVDLITIFSEETANKFLEMVKPDIYVKGGEYNLQKLSEAALVRKLGGKTVQIPMIHGFSTTKLISKIKKI